MMLLLLAVCSKKEGVKFTGDANGGQFRAVRDPLFREKGKQRRL